ncbi:MAG: aminotransferase class IV, partial [Methanosarcinaceae archaeon]|nr:aminotransferase class IV [Methanosarcinaceae archaeon]
NIFFIIGDEITTPALNGSILPGITRDSTLQLLRAKGYNATERRISAEELYEAYQKGELKEVFGTGTAAVISPVGELLWNGHKMIINNGEIGKISQMIYDTITGIQSGKLEDEFGWTQKVE